MNDLIKFLQQKIKNEESTAEVHIQEIDDETESDKCFARIEAYNSVIEFLTDKGRDVWTYNKFDKIIRALPHPRTPPPYPKRRMVVVLLKENMDIAMKKSD